MGLTDFQTSPNSIAGRRYPDHQYQDEIESWMEELKKDLPDEVDVEFIEVSTDMPKSLARAYKKKRGDQITYYIRVSDRAFKGNTDNHIKSVILHELVHIWFWEHVDKKITERSVEFTYVLGAVGAQVSGFNFDDYMITDCLSKFSDYL